MGLDISLHGYFQETATFHTGVEKNLVFQVITDQGMTLKGSIGYRVDSFRIRMGDSLGLSFYVAL